MFLSVDSWVRLSRLYHPVCSKQLSLSERKAPIWPSRNHGTLQLL